MILEMLWVFLEFWMEWFFGHSCFINKDVEDGVNTNLVNQDRAFCPVIYDAKILDAVTNFRKLRIRSMFSEDEMTDVVDMGIQQSDLHKDIKVLENKVSGMEEKLNKIDKIEEDLEKIQTNLNF